MAELQKTSLNDDTDLVASDTGDDGTQVDVSQLSPPREPPPDVWLHAVRPPEVPTVPEEVVSSPE
eukprot:3034774-Pyramimonas_sp.AAC.1